MQFRVWQTVADAFDYCWRERAAAVRFGTVPFVAVVIATGLVHRFFPQPQVLVNKAPFFFAALVAAVVQMIVYLPLYITWYRKVVLGDAETAARPMFVLGERERRLFWWQILILAIITVGFSVGAAIITAIFLLLRLVAGTVVPIVVAVPLGLALIVATFMILARLSMASVLVATDQPVSVKIAWSMTRGLGSRLTGGMALIGLAGAVVGLAIKLLALLFGLIGAMAIGATADAVVPYLDLVGQAAGGFVIFVATATLFGFVYRLLTGRVITDSPAA